jgi:hypothetical protein
MKIPNARFLTLALVSRPGRAAAGAGGRCAGRGQRQILCRAHSRHAAPDAPLQRLLLPAEALVRLQSAGYADLRLFNAAGQPVPMALASVPTQTSTQKSRASSCRPIPSWARQGAAAAGLEGLSLRIEERQGRRVVQLNTGGATTASGGAAKSAGRAARCAQAQGARGA